MKPMIRQTAIFVLALGMACGILAATPVASFTINPATGDVPVTITFDGSGSTDPNGGTIIRYDWFFGDGQQSLGNTGPTIAHTYTVAGIYISSLTITTSEGPQATKTDNIIVYNITPVF